MNKVKTVELFDYKAFARFKLSAREKNVLVGPNNAGKSTLLDAFRITFDVLRFANRRKAILKSQGSDSVCATWLIPPSAVQSELRNCIHNFGDGKAKLTIRLENESTLVVLIEPEGPLECYLKTENAARKSTSFLSAQFPLKLVIVPTLSPLEQNEEFVQEDTVERNRYSRLASRNFRNFWFYRSKEEFEAFADLVEAGWPGVRVQRPVIERGDPKNIVRMYFRQGPNVREVQWAGFGFQVWMQTMMHLITADKDSTLILDEPDVYLHPDLQHRLLEIVAQRVGQYFIASHSTEIINAAEPGDVLIVRPESRTAKRILGESGYSDVYTAIGSSENAQFARLAKTKKVLYFEGRDAKIISRIAKKLSGTDILSSNAVTLMKTDGFSNWGRVSTSSWVFENFFGFKIPVAAIFDRDYRCDEEIDEFLKNVNIGDTQCRVLPLKEIENFLLVPQAVKAVVERFRVEPLEAGWDKEIESIFETSYEEVRSSTLSARIGFRIDFQHRKSSKSDIPTIASSEDKSFNSEWGDEDFKKKVVPGKIVFSNISRLVQERFKVTLTPPRLIDELTVADVHPDIVTILSDIQAHLNQ